jgi:uncharacterized protein (TIGR04141 family)
VGDSQPCLVLAQRGDDARWFAFAFGASGRFLLRPNAFERGYGLRAALNIIYPSTVEDDSLDRLNSVDTKRHASQVMRTRVQASRSSPVEEFALDRLRDIVGAATGKPADVDTWGRRATGRDALRLDLTIAFDTRSAPSRRFAQPSPCGTV